MKKPLSNSLRVLPGVGRYSVAGFLVALMLLFVTAPFVQELPKGKIIESALLTVVLISAVFAVGHHRKILWLAAVLMLPSMVGRWLHHFWPDQVSPKFFLVSIIVFCLFIIWHLMRFILRAPRVDSEVVCAGVASYLMLGLLWGFAYMLVAWCSHNAFLLNGQTETPLDMTGFMSVYFSFITLTTVGYGDIVPAVPVARMLAASEAMTGTLFVAILISRLVSMYSSGGDEKPR